MKRSYFYKTCSETLIKKPTESVNMFLAFCEEDCLPDLTGMAYNLPQHLIICSFTVPPQSGSWYETTCKWALHHQGLQILTFMVCWRQESEFLNGILSSVHSTPTKCRYQELQSQHLEESHLRISLVPEIGNRVWGVLLSPEMTTSITRPHSPPPTLHEQKVKAFR